MTKTDSSEKYRAPALDKGLDILELLSTQPAGMTRAEIVKALQRGPSEIYRMLERLVVRGYVRRSIEGDRFALTTKLFQMGSMHPPIRRLVTQAQPQMDLFAHETGQSVHLVIPELGQSYVVAQASSRSAWEFRLRLGAELDLFDTGSGQALLSFMTPEQLSHTMSMRSGTSHSINERLADELAQIRIDGHRIRPSQQLVGVTDITVPIVGPIGIVAGVLTCPFLPKVTEVGDDTELQAKTCLNALKRTAENIA